MDRVEGLARSICDALELAPIGVAIVDLGGTVLGMNGTLQRWVGGERAVPRLPRTLAPDGDIRCRLARVATGEAVAFETARCELVPTVRGNFSVSLSPLRKDDRVVACSVFVTDNQPEEDSSDRSMHERFRDLVEGAADGVIVARGEVLLYANRVVRDWLLQTGPEQVVGQLLSEVFDVPPLPGTGGHPLGIHDAVLRKSDGSGMPVAVSVARIPLPEGTTTVMTLRKRSELPPAEASPPNRAADRLHEALERAAAALGRIGDGDPSSASATVEAREWLALALGFLRDMGIGATGSGMGLLRSEHAEELMLDVRHLAAARAGRGTVLVCDDEARLAMLTAGLLEQHGYAAATVGTGAAALDVLKSEAIDVILLDLNLPDGNAHEVIARMREQSLDRPVILTSGYSEEDVEPTLLRSPSVTGYLAKPYSVDSLISEIEHALTARPI